MGRLLRIDSSARREGSHSRKLADHFEAAWKGVHPSDEIVRRDLAAEPIPHIDEVTIAGFYSPENQQNAATRAATRLSDRLIGELLASDAVLLSVPIYNFSIPSALKAYLDQIVRVGRTFSIDPAKGLIGMVESRPVYVTAIYGATGYGSGGLKALNYLEPYLRGVLGFIGLTNLTFFSVEGTSIDPARAAIDESCARAAIQAALAPAA